MEKKPPQLAQPGFSINKRAGMGKQAEARATAEYKLLPSILWIVRRLTMYEGYLNARILLHRPFLASVESQNVTRLESNIDPCLDAARKSIELMYSSYAHRHYFRTW